MRTFAELVIEGSEADVGGWGFSWLDGRATEERPPWGYARLLADRLATARSALDLDTGGGEVIAGMPSLPPRMAVTEGWAPNADRARRLLGPRGVTVVDTGPGARLPFADASFDLVSSRHPVRPDFAEIARVLAPGGAYLAQHVGPGSAYELIEWFLGPWSRAARDPEREVAEARAAGLDVVDLRTARCRMEFFDVGAVVWILRKCVWWVPDFDVDRYREPLRRLDAHIREHGSFVAHSTRTLIEATYGDRHVDACDRGHGAGRGGGPRPALPGR
ncbi:class I SAM-dependent methyltransferase [Actinoplanes philippinensis]|uniref:class I SAM-dependent methyltransferase n=1 Tax=Actinoplanes philippinensis TaxID=35752 RepID=UPI0033C8A26F